jgi:iron complex transport system substrate-binding protein
MKIKNKIIALVEIAIVLCSLFLVTIPAIAAEQTTQEVSASEVTTASADDYVLGIYGNANEDDTIDMRDLTYVKLIFFGKKPETELADAKYDGKINPLDFIQIKLIIVDNEKEITIVDSADRIVTVKKPVEQIIAIAPLGGLETMRSLKLEKDKIVGVSKQTLQDELFYPEFSDYPNAGPGGWGEAINVEQILSLHPDVVFLFASSYQADGRKKLEDAGVTVVCFDYFRMKSYIEEVKKTGFILGKKEEADDLTEFYEGWLNTIKERVEDIPEEERAKVYIELWNSYYTCGKEWGYHQDLEMAGGNNIFSDLAGSANVDPEEVIERNPEIIIKLGGYKTMGYGVDDLTGAKDTRDEILSRPELAGVIAVKNKKAYIISGTITASGQSPVGIGYMAKSFYPDLFKDLNPKAFHQEYLTRFQGLDYDLDKQGVFVYPEPS